MRSISKQYPSVTLILATPGNEVNGFQKYSNFLRNNLPEKRHGFDRRCGLIGNANAVCISQDPVCFGDIDRFVNAAGDCCLMNVAEGGMQFLCVHFDDTLRASHSASPNSAGRAATRPASKTRIRTTDWRRSSG